MKPRLVQNGSRSQLATFKLHQISSATESTALPRETLDLKRSDSVLSGCQHVVSCKGEQSEAQNRSLRVITSAATRFRIAI